MNETVTGVIQSKRKDGKGVKIDDTWYSSRNASYFAACNKQDSVTLQFTRNQQWNNCDENIAPVVGQSAPSAGGGGGGGRSSGGGGGGSQFRSVDELIRTDSLNSALTFLSNQPVADYAEQIEKTLKTAELFVAYTKGLIDLSQTSAASAPAPEPEQYPEPPPQPEPEPVAQTSALSAFMGS